MRTKPVISVLVFLLIYPLSGQILKIGLSSKVITLNPYFALDNESRQVCDIIYTGLIDLNNQLETVPVLARTHSTQWLLSNENGLKKLTIPLRNDVRWHDASRFTSLQEFRRFSASDVVQSFNLLKLSPELPYSRKVRDISEMKQLNNNIEVIFEKGRFSYKSLNFAILPYFYTNSVQPPLAADNFRFGTLIGGRPLVSGTGYYKLKEWNPLLERIILERSDNGLSDHRSSVSDIQLSVNTDPEARINDLINGNIHLVLDLEPEYAQQINQPLQAINYPSVFLAAIFFNYDPTRKNFNHIIDRRLRQALITSVNTKRIYQEVYSVLGEFPGVTGPFLPGQGSYNDAIQPHKFDPVKAKALVSPAAKRATFTLLTYDESEKKYNEAICTKIADDYWNALDLKVKVVVASSKQDYYNRIHRSEFDFVLYEWASWVKPDVSMWEKPLYEDGVRNNNNFCQYEYLGDASVSDLVFYNDLNTIKYEREDNQKIFEAYKRVHRVLHEDYSALFLWNKKIYVAMNRDPRYGFGPDRLPNIQTNPINFLKSLKDW